MEHPDTDPKFKRIGVILGFILINFFRALLGVIRNKILAVFHGVSSIGLLGQFLNFDGMIGKIILVGTTASLVNTYHDSDRINARKEVIILANLALIIISSIISVCLLIIFAHYFAKLIYLDEQYTYLIYIGICLNIIYVFSTFFELVYQAKQAFNYLLKARLFGIFTGFVTIYPLVFYRDIEGVIFNMIIVYFFTFIYLLYKWIVSHNLKLAQFIIYIKELQISVFRNIIKIILADISRTFVVYGSLLLVRIIIIQKIGDINAGYYHAILSISNYLNIILEGFIVYYYPVLCAIHDKHKIKTETNINYEILFYLIFPIVFFIGLFSGELLNIFYTKEFVGVSSLLSVLIGTKLFYLYYYFFSINLLAKNYLKKFIFAELLRSIILVITSYIFIDYWDFKGAIYGVIVTEFISIIIIWSLKRKIIEFNLNKLNSKNSVYAGLIFLFLLSNVFDKLYMLIVIIIISIFTFDIRKYFVVFETFKSLLIRKS